jgi:tetratricopeptide (TPR) repeat protein
VLLKDPQRHDLRQKLVRLAIDVDRLELAQQHLRTLQNDLKDNGAVDQLQAQLATAQKNWTEAAAWYRKAIEHAPQQIDSYGYLADLLRRQSGEDKDGKAAQEADQIIDDLAAKNPDSYKAHLVRWQYRKQWLGLEKAQETAADDVAAALRLAPEDAEVLLAAAELAQAEKQPERARTLLQQGKQRHPQDPRMYRELAVLELRQDRRNEALACLRDGVKALSGPPQAEVLWTLGNVLIDGRELSEARAVIAQMVKARASSVATDYLNARIRIDEANWAEAARLLDRTRLQLVNAPELANQVDLLLAQCFEQLDDPTSRLSALGRIIGRDRSSVSARLGMAGALAAAGRFDDALDQYSQLMALPGAPPAGWIEIARLMVVRELQRSQRRAGGTTKPKRAAWKPVEEALARAEKANPDAVDVLVLRAEVLVAQGKVDQARKQLTEAVDKQKDKVQLWAALAGLAMLEDQGKDLKEATRLLEEARKNAGDTPELRQVQIEFWARQGGPQAVETLAGLTRNLDRLSPRDQSRLLGDIAAAYYRIGETKQAAQLWNRLAQEPQNKSDLRLRLILFDLALQEGDDPAMQRVLAELKQIEGEQGTLWRYAAAVRLIRRAQLGNRDGLVEARGLLDAVAARRPEWPSVLVAKADLEEASNNLDQAIADYRRAIGLGERGPRVVRQLVQLLYKQQRYQEADQEVRRLQDQTTDVAEAQRLQRLAVAISLQNEDRDRALELIRDQLAADSKDYRDHLWQGQVLAASGLQDEQAEKELRKALALDDTVPEIWVTLVQFLVRKERVPEAERAIAMASSRLPADKAALPLALCYEAVGKLEPAREQYQRAVKDKPGDVLLHRALAAFYIRSGQVSEAEPILRKVIDRQLGATAADAAWARRALALALIGRGDYQKAFPLIGLRLETDGRISESPIAPEDDPTDEQRIRAQVLATQMWREPRKKAITLLEELGRRRALLPDDQFLLAQLYVTDGDGAWPKARDMLRLLTGPGKNPAYLAYYAQAALRQRDREEAERCIGYLEQIEKARRLGPNALGAVELRAALLEAKGDKDKALALIRAHVDRAGAKPEEVFLLIGALTRQKQYAEALALCTKARATCPAEAVAKATLAVLRQAKASEQTCAEVESWLKSLCVDDGKSPASLWISLADLQDLRGRYDDAEACCRTALARGGRNPVALNNLAWLLAQKQGKAKEALELIEEAIKIAGPRGELLDTRASVYIALNRAGPALQDLEAALADGQVPTRYFHLAQAHRLANNSKQAADALQKAGVAGLTRPDQLHPAERAAFVKLKNELEQR